MEFISAALEVIGGIKAKSEAEKYAGIQAGMERDITAAKIDNINQEERLLAGQTRARTAGSNIKADVGSPLTILAEQAKNFAKDRMLTAQVGATKASNTLLSGKMTGRQALYSGWSTGLEQAASAAKSAFAMI